MALVIAAVNKGVSLVAEADSLVLLPEIFGSGPGDGGGEIRPEHEGISFPVKKFIEFLGRCGSHFPAEDVKTVFSDIRRSVCRGHHPGYEVSDLSLEILLFAFCFHMVNCYHVKICGYYTTVREKSQSPASRSSRSC